MNDPIYEKLADEAAGWIGNIVKQAGASGAVLGLSGGIDSAVTAALCVRALGKENVLGLVMPCGSTSRDTEDGHRTAEHLGIPRRETDLTGVLRVFTSAGVPDPDDVLCVANVKARLRMTMLYAHSRNRLVAGTGNLSEANTGYSTKWGDGAADLLPLGQLWKQEVYSLAECLGLPAWVLSRVPSAGLWEGQSDEDEMGVTYDEIMKFFVEGEETVSAKASSRIGRLYRSSMHKRNPIPVFKAREFLDGK